MWDLILYMRSAVRLLRTPRFGRASAHSLGGQQSIATPSPGLAPRTTIGPAIGARGCPSQAGVNGVGTALISSTSSKAPRTSTLPPDSMVIVLAKVRGTAPHVRYSSPRVRGQGECWLESLRSHRSRLHGPVIYIKIAEPPARHRLDELTPRAREVEEDRAIPRDRVCAAHFQHTTARRPY